MKLQICVNTDNHNIDTSRKAAQAVEDYGTLADLGMKIATAMFSNMDEFGDEMMDIVDGGIDRRNNAKGF